MFTSYKGLKPFQTAEYICLILLAFFVPMSYYGVATIVMVGLFICTILKGIFESGFKANELQYKNKFAYFLFIAFWLIYAVSLLYSDDTAESISQIGKRLSFLLLPLFFLCSDLSYLNKDRVRTIMYCFVFGILALFLVNLIWAGYDMIFEGAKVSRFYDPRFLKDGTGYIHHTYISIYCCLGISFCFCELFADRNVKVVIFNVIAVIMLMLFTVLSSSRAGILCMVGVLVLLWLWLIFFKKEKQMAIGIGVIMIAVLLVSSMVFKKSVNRITDTISNIDDVEKQDRRVGLMIGYKDLLTDEIWFGVGAGDRSEEMLKSFQRKMEEIVQNIKPIDDYYSDDFDQRRRACLDSINKKSKGKLNNSVYEYAKEMSEKYGCDYNSVRENIATYINVNVAYRGNFNPHNQYSDTIIAVGILGLLLILGFLLAPIYLWIRNKTFDIVFFSWLFIIAFNCLFESILERQMGIIPFVFMYFLLFHYNFCQNRYE